MKKKKNESLDGERICRSFCSTQASSISNAFLLSCSLWPVECQSVTPSKMLVSRRPALSAIAKQTSFKQQGNKLEQLIVSNSTSSFKTSCSSRMGHVLWHTHETMRFCARQQTVEIEIPFHVWTELLAALPLPSLLIALAHVWRGKQLLSQPPKKKHTATNHHLLLPRHIKRFKTYPEDHGSSILLGCLRWWPVLHTRAHRANTEAWRQQQRRWWWWWWFLQRPSAHPSLSSTPTDQKTARTPIRGLPVPTHFVPPKKAKSAGQLLEPGTE